MRNSRQTKGRGKVGWAAGFADVKCHALAQPTPGNSDMSIRVENKTKRTARSVPVVFVQRQAAGTGTAGAHSKVKKTMRVRVGDVGDGWAGL